MRHQRWVPAGFLAVALLAAACGSQSSPGSGSASATASGKAAGGTSMTATVKTAKTSLGDVLTNGKGFTVYWFSKDTPGSSACTGSCAAKWPPVLGKPEAAGGITLPGKLGTFTRSGGAVQATYDGHPLYTFAGDSAAGQTHGNLINAFGGIWYAQTVTGAGGASPTPSSSPSSSSGGYGY